MTDDLMRKLDSEGRIMKWQHWAGIVVLLAIGYWVGTTYPQFWTKFTAA